MTYVIFTSLQFSLLASLFSTFFVFRRMIFNEAYKVSVKKSAIFALNLSTLLATFYVVGLLSFSLALSAWNLIIK